MPRCLPRRSRPASIGCSGSAARTRLRRWPTARARCRAWTRSSDRAIAGSRRQSRSISSDCGIDFYAGPTEILIVTASGTAVVDRRRSARAGRARSRRARGPHHHQPRDSPSESPPKSTRQMPATGPARQSIARHGGIIVCPSLNEAIALANDAAAEHVVAGTESIARQIAQRRRGVRRRVDRAGRRRLRDRIEPRAAHRRRGPVSRRTERRRLREAGLGPARDQARTRSRSRRQLRRWRERKASKPTPSIETRTGTDHCELD